MKPLLLLLTFGVALVTLHADPPVGMTTDFEWFGKLGFPEVKKLKFVRYSYGWSSDGTGRREEMWSHGFLLEDRPEKLRVLTIELAPLEFPQGKRDADANYRYEPADLRAFAEAELRPVDPKAGLFSRSSLVSGPHFTERTHLFVLGWICSRAGLDDLAARLYATAQTSVGLGWQSARNTSKDEKEWPFRHKLERDLGHFEMWQTIVAFGDLRVPRRELRARLRALPGRFPHCDHLVRAESLAKRLEQMIAEDDAHPPRSIEDIAGLPPDEQAKEWVFRLRDQNGVQMGQPGWVDIFMTPAMREDSPAHRLVKLGDAAVPLLMAALGDPRLTRSVGYTRDFFFSHEVVTVGDAALKIIERIAGREFYRSGNIQGSMTRDGETDPVRVAVQDWWSKRQSKGARGELAETTARGDFSSARTGAKLFAEFPDDAATPILAGAAAAQRDEERCEFIRLVGKLKDDRAPEFLLREAREGPLIGPRAEAAWQLAKLGRLDGIASLAELWRRSAPSSKMQENLMREKLICVLAMTDSPEGIHALAEGLGQRSIEARRRVLKAIGSERHFLLMRFGEYEQWSKAPPALSATTAVAVEDLLAAELEDTAATSGSSGFRDGKRFDNPRLCDEAATLLAARWPERYAFDIEASYPIRERQRISCLNVWRKAHGQPPLPLPPERPKVAAGDELKIAEVAFAAGLEWPEPMLAVLRAAKGRVISAALFEETEHAFLDACGGVVPAPYRGFFIELFLENATDGITLFAAPAGRKGTAERPEREWSIDYQATSGESGHQSARRSDIFGKNVSSSGNVSEIFRKIIALPAGTPFRLRMELAPNRRDLDNAF